MRVVLVELTPFDPVAAAPVTLRLSSHDDVRACLLNGQTWWPALLKKGTLGIDLFDPTYSGRVQPGFGGIEFDLSAYPDAGRYVWGDKPAKVYVGTIGDAWPYTTRFDGLTVAATTDRGRVSVGLRVNDAWFANPQLATYTGAGNSDVAIEGTADLKGRSKPLAIGQPKYVEPVPVDRVNNVYQFHAYGSAQGVLAALDRLVRFPASVGNFGSYSALVAAAVPRGRFATCLAQGLVRFGAPPDGVVSLLVQGDNGGPDGWVRTPGKVIKRLAKIAGATDAQIDAVSLAALDVAVPRNLSLYRTEQATVGDVVRRVAASCNGVAGISWLSKLFVARAVIGAPALTLKSDGTALPQVGEPKLLEAGAPYHELRLQYDRCWRVHDPEEIAFTAPFVDLGDYVAGTVYREGNIVRSTTDGKRYLYTNPTPTSGNAPPNGAFWAVHETATSAATLVGAVDYVSQVGGTKPPTNADNTASVLTTKGIADGATVGAPAGSPVNGIDAALVQQAAAAGKALDDAVGDNNKLSKAEKRAIVPWIDALSPNVATIVAQANAAGLTTDATAFQTAWNNYIGYLQGLGGVAPNYAYRNYTINTNMVGATYEARVSALQSAIQILQAKGVGTALWTGIADNNGAKPADFATRDVVMVNHQFTAIRGNNVTKISNGGAWDGSAYSVDVYQSGCRVTGNCFTPGTFIGLNETISQVGFGDLPYSFHRSTDGNLYAYEGGALVQNFGAVADANTRLTILYDSVNVRYYVNQSLFRIVASAPNRTFRAKVTLFGLNDTITGLSFAPHSINDFSFTGGTTRPENNATVGADAGANFRIGGVVAPIERVDNDLLAVDQPLAGQLRLRRPGTGISTITPIMRAGSNLARADGGIYQDGNISNGAVRGANIFVDPNFERVPSATPFNDSQPWNDWGFFANPAGAVLVENAADGRRLRFNNGGGSEHAIGVYRRVSAGERVDFKHQYFQTSSIAGTYFYLYVDYYQDNSANGIGAFISGAPVWQPVLPFDTWNDAEGHFEVPASANIAWMRLRFAALITAGSGFIRNPVAYVTAPAIKNISHTGKQKNRKLQRALLNAGGAHVSGLTLSSNDSQINISNFSIDTSDGYQAITGELVGGLAAGTTYYIWANLPDQDNNGRSFSLSTSFNGHTNAERVRLGAWATTSGGAGGGGSNNCVALDSFIDVGVRARDVGAGTRIRLLKRDYSGWEWGEVESVEWATSPMVRIVTESAKTLEVAETTPIEFRDGSFTEARFLTGCEVAVLVGDRMRWERVVRVQPIGVAEVARIHVDGRVYFAGMSMRALIASHNPDKP